MNDFDFITNQAGATSAVTLMVLVMLFLSTMLGISSIQNTTNQNQIARNIQLKQIGLRNADTTLGLGETRWKELMQDCYSDLSECQLDFAPPYQGIDVTNQEFWVADQNSLGNADSFGIYNVEYFDKKPIPGDSERILHFYRITAKANDLLLQADGSTSPNASSEVIVQSIIQICARVDGSGIC